MTSSGVTRFQDCSDSLHHGFTFFPTLHRWSLELGQSGMGTFHREFSWNFLGIFLENIWHVVDHRTCVDKFWWEFKTISVQNRRYGPGSFVVHRLVETFPKKSVRLVVHGNAFFYSHVSHQIKHSPRPSRLRRYIYNNVDDDVIWRVQVWQRILSCYLENLLELSCFQRFQKTRRTA